MTITIEAGKSYVDAQGRVYGPAMRDGDGDWSLQDEDDKKDGTRGWMFTNNGICHAIEHRNLVAEHPAPQPDTATADAAYVEGYRAGVRWLMESLDCNAPSTGVLLNNVAVKMPDAAILAMRKP